MKDYTYPKFPELPIACDDLEPDIEVINYNDGEFLKTFGPWQQGYQFKCLSLYMGDNDSWDIKEYDEDGKMLNECKVTLTPVV